MTSIRIPNGCKSRPGIEQVLRYPVETRKLECVLKEYFDLLRMDKELLNRDPRVYKYLVDRQNLKKGIDAVQISKGYPDSLLFKLLTESYLKYGMQIQQTAIDEFILLQNIKEHYLEMTKGPEPLKPSESSIPIPDSLTPRSKPEYFSPRSKDLDRGPSTREVPNTPIRINGVIYYPQPMYQESNTKVLEQNQLVGRLQKEVEECNNVIDDLRERINKTASRDIIDGGPSVLYTDRHTPTRLAEDFNSVFLNEWPAALKCLVNDKSHGEATTEDDAILLLMNIVQMAYEFCSQSASDQLQKLSLSLERGLEDPFVSILDLRYTQYDQKKRIPETLMKELKRLRKSEHVQCIVHATQRFKDNDLLRNPKYNYRHAPEIEAFVNAMVEVLWLMAIQEPPMEIKWPQPHDRFNESLYQPYKKQGTVVKSAVWPAIFLHHKGPLIKKGYAQPM